MSATLFQTTTGTLPQSARPARTLMLSIVAGGAIAGFVLTGAEPAAQATALAGEDLTRLLRSMALIKAVMALAAAASVLWRLGSPVTPTRFAAYAVAAATMAAGPGLIWTMAHVGLGAFLLHAGLLATILLLWRDPVVHTRLANLIAARRRAAAGCKPM